MKPIPTWRETLGNSLIFVVVGAVGQAMQQEIDVLRTRLADVEKDAARMSIAAKAALFAMYSALDNYGNTTRERDAMRTENAQLKESRDEYSEAVERLSVHREEMLKDRVALAIENERLKAELAAMKGDRTFAGWFTELDSAMSYRLWEQGGCEPGPGDVALYAASGAKP